MDRISEIYDDQRITAEEALDLMHMVSELSRLAQHKGIDGLNGEEEAKPLASISQEGGRVL